MPAQAIANDRLDGWKEIGVHLNRHPRTAMRWAEEKDLPVHRVPGGDRQAVFAYRHEIDAWLLNHRSVTQTASIAGTPVTAPSVAELPSPQLPEAHLADRRSSPIESAAFVALALLLASVALWYGLRPKAITVSGLTQLSDDAAAKSNLVTDGSRLYFSESIGSEDVVSSMPVSGGEISRMNGPRGRPVDISADGKLLLVLAREGYEEEHPLWIVPTGGGPSRQLGSIRCQAAAWTPDGKSIAYATGDLIYLAAADGSQARAIAQTEGPVSSLRWSKDGRRLTYMTTDSDAAHDTLWRLELDAQLRVTKNLRLEWPDGDCCTAESLVWDGDTYISATRDIEGNHMFYLRTRHFWGRTQFERRDLASQLKKLAYLARDPAGKRLFLVGNGPTKEDLIEFEDSSRFSLFLPSTPATFVDFAKESDWITYTRPTDLTLWISRKDGTGARQVSPASMNVELPRWSPDGKQIAFMGKVPGRPWRIFVVTVAGGGPREASQSQDEQGAPTWSPDGRFIVYGNVYCLEAHACAIHKIDLTSGEVSTLPGSQGLGTARWSPDGRFIAALSAGRRELYIYDVAREAWSKLADSINGNDLSWSADSRFVYANPTKNGEAQIVRIPVEGGPAQMVMNFNSLSKSVGYLDTWFAVTPSGAILRNRWLGGSEIYALDYAER